LDLTHTEQRAPANQPPVVIAAKTLADRHIIIIAGMPLTGA